MRNTKINKKLVILIGEGNYFKIPILEELKKIGEKENVKIFIADFKEQNFSKNYFPFLKISKNINESMKILKNFLKEEKPDVYGISTYVEKYVLFTSKIAEKLKLKYLPHEVAKKTTNKFYLYEFLRKKGLFKAKFNRYKLKDQKDFVENILSINKKEFILKPSNEAGSRGVIKIDESLKNIKFLKNHFKYLKSIGVKEYLIMDYLDGDEFSIEGLVQNGKFHIVGISEKFKLNGPFFIEKGDWSIPHSLNKKETDLIVNYLKKCLKALKFNNCTFHAEIRFDKDGNPHLIDLGSRPGGDYIFLFCK